MTTSKKGASKASKALRTKKTAAKALVQPAKRRASRMPIKAGRSTGGVIRGPDGRRSSNIRPAVPSAPRGNASDEPCRPESVSEETIARLVAEAEAGIPAEKLRRRGRPAIGNEAASTYSVRLPDDLVSLADERSEIDSVTRGETIRRALIEYLTK
jgi:hypothetical protein